MSATSRSRLLAVVLGLTVLLAPGTAAAKGGDDPAGSDDGAGATASASTGDFAVTVNGRTTNPAAGQEARLRDVTPTGPIAVRGQHVGFTIAPRRSVCTATR